MQLFKSLLCSLLLLCAGFVYAAVETIENGETGLSVRNKINGNFTELEQRANTASSAITTLQTETGQLNTRTNALESVTAHWTGELTNSHWPTTGIDLSSPTIIAHSFTNISATGINYTEANQQWALPSGRYQFEFSALYLPTASNGQLELCLQEVGSDQLLVCQRHSYSPFDLYQDIASTVRLTVSVQGGRSVKLVYAATCEGASVSGFGRLNIQQLQ